MEEKNKGNGKKLDTVRNSNVIETKSMKKPGKYFYQKYIGKNCQGPQKLEEKWVETFEKQFDETEWQFFYSLPYKVTKDTQLRYLQIKILHRIIPTNSWLFKCNLTNTNQCSFCEIHRETIIHLFWECTFSKSIWLNLKDWLITIDRNLRITLGPKEIILGENRDNCKNSIEHIKLITKEYLYRSKLQNRKPVFKELIYIIKMKISIEKHHLNNDTFTKKWGEQIIRFFNL